MALYANEDPLSGMDVLRGITDRVTFRNIGIVIPITNLRPKEPGQYLIYTYAMCYVTGIGAGQLDIIVSFTDETGSQSITQGTLSLSNPNVISTVFLIRSINGLVSLSTNLFGAFNGAKYDLYSVSQKL